MFQQGEGGTMFQQGEGGTMFQHGEGGTKLDGNSLKKNGMNPGTGGTNFLCGMTPHTECRRLGWRFKVRNRVGSTWPTPPLPEKNGKWKKGTKVVVF